MTSERSFWHLILPPLAILVTLLGGMGFRLARLEGILRPIRIEGPSLGETASGLHYRLACRRCLFPWRCDAQRVPSSLDAVCPNCGEVNSLAELSPFRGSGAIVDRGGLGSLQRYDLVAVRREEGDFLVKRLYGFPGEAITFRSGDLFIDARRPVRSWRQVRESSATLYDSHHHPTDRPEEQWAWQIRDGRKSTWKGTLHPISPPATPKNSSPRSEPASAQKLRFSRAWPEEQRGPGERRGPGDPIDWLDFQPLRTWQTPYGPFPSAEDQNDPATYAVVDNDPYNAASSRRMHVVRDLGIAVAGTFRGDGRLVVSLPYGGRLYFVSLWPRRGYGEATASPSSQWADHAILGKIMAERIAPFRFPIVREGVSQWHVAICDGRLIAATRNGVWLNEPIDLAGEAASHDPAFQSTAAQQTAATETAQRKFPRFAAAIGVSGMKADLETIRVWRDRQLHGPNGEGGADSWSPATMSPESPNDSDSWFVLGDNLPASQDSRDPYFPAVRTRDLLGKVRIVP